VAFASTKKRRGRLARAEIRRVAGLAALVTSVLFAVLLIALILVPWGVAAADSVTRYDQADAHIAYSGTWDTFDKTAAWKGTYRRSSDSDASAIITFAGTRLDWITMKGTTTGLADVYLNDVYQTTVDLSSATAVYRQNVYTTGDLPAGTYTVRIVRSPSAATGDFITIDAVDITGTLVYSAPTIASLAPDSAWTGGGQSVVIKGTSFTGVTSVTFGGSPATSFTVNTSSKITAVAPAHAAGTVRVQVTGLGGPTADSPADDFTYEDASVPTITGLSSDAGTSSGGNVVVITGTGFVGMSGFSAVTFGGVNASSYTVDSSNQITATTPAHMAGSVRAQVTSAGGTTADTAADDFTYMNRYDDRDSRLSYAGAWGTYEWRAAWGAAYKRTTSSSGAVTITFTGTRLDLIATRGITMGAADVYLDDVLQGSINLHAATAYKQRVWSTGNIDGGVHKVKMIRKPGIASTAYINLDAVEVVGALGRAGRIEQTDSRLAFSGAWSALSASGASGGSYGRSSEGGSAVTVDFHGTYLSWIATKGTTLGSAWVKLDSGAEQKVDLSAAAVAYQQNVWNTGPLTDGDHVVKIWYDDGNAAGKFISIDAFDIQGTLDAAYASTRFEQTDSRLIYSGTWATTTAGSASNGSYKSTTSAAASLIVTFSGVQLDWIAARGPGLGLVDVSVDGGAPVTVDLSSPTTVNQDDVWSTGALSNGAHMVEFSLNEYSPEGAAMTVDAFDIQGTLPSSSALTSAEVKWAEQRLADLSYRPGSIDGEFDLQTTSAVIAFQKWEGLSRTGTIGATTWTRLQTASRPVPSKTGTTNPWIEVNKTKQVLLYCKKGQVVWTIPVSTGNASVGVITPAGTFAIFSKETYTKPCYFSMGVTTYMSSQVAIHGYPHVPTYAASHGCVRTQIWDQDAIFPVTNVGTKVYIY
jgi:hypothetical protein